MGMVERPEAVSVPTIYTRLVEVNQIRNIEVKECFMLSKRFLLDNISFPSFIQYLRTLKEQLK